MSKLTQIQRQQLKDLVIDAAVRRLTNLEMTDYIQSQMQITISQDYLKHVKSSIRKEGFQQLQVYRADQMSYLTEIFLEPVSELKLMKKTLHQIIENEEEDTEARIKAIAQLQNVNSQMIGYYQYLPRVMKAVGGECDGDLNNKDLTFANDTASLSSANNRNNLPAGHWWCTGNCNVEHWDEFRHHCREYAVGAEGEEIEGYFATPRDAGDNNDDDDSYYATYAKANKGKSWECKMGCNRTHTFGSDECPRWEIGNDEKEKDKKSNPQRKF